MGVGVGGGVGGGFPYKKPGSSLSRFISLNQGRLGPGRLGPRSRYTPGGRAEGENRTHGTMRRRKLPSQLKNAHLAYTWLAPDVRVAYALIYTRFTRALS